VLAFGATTAMGFWSGFGTAAAAGQQPHTNPALKFSVSIPGLPEASKGVRAVTVDAARIDVPEILKRDNETWGRDQEIWNINAGDVHPGSATFTITGTPSVFKELKAWFADSAVGQKIRKSITVTLRHPETGAERTYVLSQCFPTSWSAVNFDTSSTVQTETLTVKVGRLEFKT
jgi:hypothetical protein